MNPQYEHYCNDVENFPLEKFFQRGKGQGQKVLLIGESPAANGWRKSGKACYSPDGKLLATGKRLNELLGLFNLSVEVCGFTELAKCYVGNNKKLLKECSRKCWPILLKQLTKNPCNLLIILGVHTTHLFTQLSKHDLVVGEMTEIKFAKRSYVVLPIYHPSPINPYSRAKNREIFTRLHKEIEEILSA